MPHDAQQIINTANSFILAADRCVEQRPLALGQFQMLIVPAVVCAAFAIELYFKAIITLEGGSAKGHDLSDLFSRLSSNSQRALTTHLSVTQPAFVQKLKEISGAFVEWRYIFEQQTANIDMVFLNGLAKASRFVVESMSKPSTN